MERAEPPSSDSRADKKSFAQKLGRTLLSGVSLVVVAYLAYDLTRKWDASEIELRFPWIGLATIATTFSIYAQGRAYHQMIQSRSGSVSAAGAFSIFLSGQLARYLPGKVGLPLVRMTRAAEVGQSPMAAFELLLAETLNWISWGVALGAGGLLVSSTARAHLPEPLGALAGLALVGALLGLFVLSFVDVKRLPALLSRRLNSGGSGRLIPWSGSVWMAGHWIFISLQGVFLGLAVAPLGFRALDVGIAITAGISLGFLSLLAPAGAGVRELLSAALISPLVGVKAAVVVGLLSRAVSLGTELAAFLGFRAFGPRSKAD